MKSMYGQIAAFIHRTTALVLIVGLLSACGTQTVATSTSASQSTEEAVPAISSPQGTETPTDTPLSTDTAVPTEPVMVTEPAAATQPVGQSPQGATVSFTNDVLPIIESRCINCHGGDRTEEGLVLKTHADLMAGSDNGPVVSPGDAVNSLLIELVTAQKMPKRGPKLTPPQILLITEWVNQGAPNN